KLNGVEPERWLRYVLSHIQDWPANRVRELLPWKPTLPMHKCQDGSNATLTLRV
ncbi:transposase domain-containing protein, partial [Serratia marcescens]